MVDISVVVPSLKTAAELEVVEYLERGDFHDYEVLVQDETPVTRARNEGYQRARAEKILFLDDDSRPRPGYLREASATLEHQAAVAGRTVHPNDDFLAGQLTAHYDFGPEPRHVQFFWGNNMGLRRETLDAVGGWDEEMDWGHEEKELAHRVTREFDIYYNPRMVVDHVYAESMWDYWRKQYRLELSTPYYWGKLGLTRRQMWARLLSDLLTPSRYLGRTPALVAARTGRNVANALGRAVGLRRGTVPDPYPHLRERERAPTRAKPELDG